MPTEPSAKPTATGTPTWKLVLLGFLVACFALFMLQNREILELRFLFWKFETRRAYMLLAVFGSGLTMGWIVATISQLSARARENSAHSARQSSRRS